MNTKYLTKKNNNLYKKSLIVASTVSAKRKVCLYGIFINPSLVAHLTPCSFVRRVGFTGESYTPDIYTFCIL